VVDEDGVPVGLGILHYLWREDAAGARPVLDEDGLPKRFDIDCATTRATVSVGPGAKGTIMVIARVGYCCAVAAPASIRNAPAKPASFHGLLLDERFIRYRPVLKIRGTSAVGAPGGIRTHDPWLRRPIL
jgi:hypothetical protein